MRVTKKSSRPAPGDLRFGKAAKEDMSEWVAARFLPEPRRYPSDSDVGEQPSRVRVCEWLPEGLKPAQIGRGEIAAVEVVFGGLEFEPAVAIGVDHGGRAGEQGGQPGGGDEFHGGE